MTEACPPYLFGVRIVTLEYSTIAPLHYAAPLGPISTGDISVSLDPYITRITKRRICRVPVVRLFGPTSTGENGCATIHGFFPYFYVDWPQKLNSLFNKDSIRATNGLYFPGDTSTIQLSPPPYKSVDEFLYSLAVHIEAALATAGYSVDVPYVFDIGVVFRRSIYGFQRSRTPFLRISLLDVRVVHQAAASLFNKSFFGVDFQPYEVHLVGTQFMADMNLRGMDYAWVHKQHLLKSENSARSASLVVCDVLFHCRKEHVLNQFLTVISPDDEMDKASLSRCTEYAIVDGVFADLGKVAGHRILSSSMDFPIARRDFELGWIPAPSPGQDANDRRILCWDDMWPANYDDARSPPIGAWLNTIWQVRIVDVNQLPTYRHVHSPAEMIEDNYRTILKQFDLEFPSRNFGTEACLLQHLGQIQQQDQEMEETESFPSFVSALPRWSNPLDVSAVKLEATYRRFHRSIEKLPSKSPLKPIGSSANGFKSFIESFLSRHLIHRPNTTRQLSFYHVPPPSALSLEEAGLFPPVRSKKRRTSKEESTTAAVDIALDLSLDIRGRIMVNQKSTSEPFGQKKAMSQLTALEPTMTSSISSSVSSTATEDIHSIVQHTVESVPPSPDARHYSECEIIEVKRSPPQLSHPRGISRRSKLSNIHDGSNIHHGDFLNLLHSVCQPTSPGGPAVITSSAPEAPALASLQQTLLQRAPRRTREKRIPSPNISEIESQPSPKSSVSPGQKPPGAMTVSPERTTVSDPVFNAVAKMSPHFGVHLGRLLGLELLSSIIFRGDGSAARDLEPRTLRQSMRSVANPSTSAILAMVYICRVEISSDLSFSNQIERIRRVVPGEQEFSPVWFPDKTHIDFEGVVMVNPETVSMPQLPHRHKKAAAKAWTSVELHSGEQFREKVVVDSSYLLGRESVDVRQEVKLFEVPSEMDLILWVVQRLFRQFDPSSVLGFDTFTSSIGYFVRRCEALGLSTISRQLGRLPPSTRVGDPMMSRAGTSGAAKPNKITRQSGNVTIPGRVVINIWRQIRSEIKSPQYSVHSLAASLLGITFPHYPIFTLAQWWAATSPEAEEQSALPPNVVRGTEASSGVDKKSSRTETGSGLIQYPLRLRCLNYLLRYTSLSLQLVDVLDILTKSEEVARLLGTDIWSVMSRGQQHRVECLLSRAAHAVGYLLLTAAKIQVQRQPAVMSIPLVLEPESSFYWWPVVVLDFQSLYPSILVAYNLCYSTCLGRLKSLCQPTALFLLRHPEDRDAPVFNELPLFLSSDGTEWKPLGVFGVAASKESLVRLQNEMRVRSVTESVPAEYPHHLCANVAADTVYVARDIRRGVIPALIEEIISTRVMIKESIKLVPKGAPGSAKLLRLFNHQQFGLKMVANCTYGYTTATYTGRMPCSELADSIVQTARRTLERSIAYVEGHPKWKAQVVYGDTDSLFVYLEGRSIKEAFRIGREIVNEISSINPWPMELNLEKVYAPCCLQTKKRYVGYSYSSETAAPKLDSKGIETIRRDQCPAVSNILRDALLAVFSTRDLSKLKKVLQSWWSKLLLGEPLASLSDFIFFREVKLGSYAYNRGAPAHTLPPSGIVSYAMVADWEDADCEGSVTAEQYFDYKMPVPYVVARGPPGSRLVDVVVPPNRVVEASYSLCPLSPVHPELDKRLFGLWQQERPLIINAEWYITKQRIFCLLGLGPDIPVWYACLPRPPTLSMIHRRQLTTASMSCTISCPKRMDHPPFLFGWQKATTYGTCASSNATEPALRVGTSSGLAFIHSDRTGPLVEPAAIQSANPPSSGLPDISRRTRFELTDGLSYLAESEGEGPPAQSMTTSLEREGHLFYCAADVEAKSPCIENFAGLVQLSPVEDMTEILDLNVVNLQKSLTYMTPYLPDIGTTGIVEIGTTELTDIGQTRKDVPRRSPPQISSLAGSLTLLPFLSSAASNCRVCERGFPTSSVPKEARQLRPISRDQMDSVHVEGHVRQKQLRLLNKDPPKQKQPHTLNKVIVAQGVPAEDSTIDISDDEEELVKTSSDTQAFTSPMLNEMARSDVTTRICRDCSSHTREAMWKVYIKRLHSRREMEQTAQDIEDLRVCSSCSAIA